MEEKKRNCHSCKHGMFKICNTLQNNEEYQNILKNVKGFFDENEFKFKNNFICDDYKSRYIEYPIEVSKINCNNDKGGLHDSQIGKFVKIAPCGDEYKGKTYLGIFLGDLPIGNHISYKEDTKELSVSFSTNPAIFVFEVNKIIFGCESWWGIIESEEDLKEITSEDIDNVWYVKALKTLSKEE